MSEHSTNLGMPLMVAGQALKHITHNEALVALDALVQISVLSQNIGVPPSSPNEGDRYIVAAGASGEWVGKDKQIAAYQNGAWVFYAQQTGWVAWVADENILAVWSGSLWIDASGDAVNPADLVGVNTLADATNKFAVKSDAALFSHDDVTPGTGDMQIKVNKAAAGNSGSVLFQSSWSGRAEFGLTGDDDWHVKVSPDGSSWSETLVVDKSNGQVRFPQGVIHAETGQRPQSFIGMPGSSAIFRVDGLHDENPRTATISTISGTLITLTNAMANVIFTSYMDGNSMVRIWNLSKSPEDCAWVSASPATNQLTVQNANDISGWLTGETIQVGDPTSITPGRCMAFDISPAQIAAFGSTFRQAGVFVKYYISGDTNVLSDVQITGIGVTPSGVGGSFNNAQSSGKGVATQGILYVPCSELSPISNSNLVYVRENGVSGISNSISTSLVSCLGLLVEM